jgi:hypothetical protein
MQLSFWKLISCQRTRMRELSIDMQSALEKQAELVQEVIPPLHEVVDSFVRLAASDWRLSRAGRICVGDSPRRLPILWLCLMLAK